MLNLKRMVALVALAIAFLVLSGVTHWFDRFHPLIGSVLIIAMCAVRWRFVRPVRTRRIKAGTVLGPA